MEEIKKLIDWKTFFSYCIVGGGSVLVQFGVLTLFVEKFFLNPTFSSGSAFIIGCLFQYLLLYYWTFRSRNQHKRVAFRYSIVLLFSFFLNLAFFWTLAEVIQWHYQISQAVATLLVCFINYFFNKAYTFAD